MNDNLVGVAGLGFLGRGIAACLVAHDCRVVAFDRAHELYPTVRSYIQQAVDELIERAGFPDSLADEWPARITFASDLAELAPVQFVVESVVEDLAVKRQVFDQLEQHVALDVPIASNTSSIPISTLAEGRRAPQRMLGMHWAEPAYATRFLELIRGAQTSDAAFDRAVALGERLGKDPCVVKKDVPAFIVNRLGYALYREAIYLVESGVADVETVDRAFQNAVGLWATFAGPLRWIDLTGGPALYGKAMEHVLPTLSTAAELPPLLRELMESDARGTANGRGFYQYTADEARQWEERFRESVWQVRKWTEEWEQKKR